jgi:mRNA-degrading endonuclease toxin of MazEF toxin-antitoxin module
MQKDFSGWHEKKHQVDKKSRPFFREREIWFAALGLNVGVEQNGRGVDFLRPIIVFRKFNSESLWAIPLTKTKKNGIFYFSFSFEPGIISVANLSQLRLIDSRRLAYPAGEMSEVDFTILNEKLKALLP